MLHRITKAVFALAATLVALAVVAVLSLAVWVMTGPKPLTKLLPTIEGALNPSGSPYRVTIDDAVIYWDGWSNPLDFRLKNVSLYTMQEEVEPLRLPEVSVGLDWPSLLLLRAVPRSVVLHKPHLRFFRDAGGAIYIGIGEDEGSGRRVALADLLEGLTERKNGAKTQNGPLESIRLIAVRNARLTLDAPGEKDPLFDAKDASLHIRRTTGGAEAELAVYLNYYDRPAQINAHIRIADQQEMLTGKIELSTISPHIFSRLFPNLPELEGLELPLHGWVNVAMNRVGEVTLIDYRLQGNGGKLEIAEHFAEPLHIDNAIFEGQIRDHFVQFTINKAELQFGGATLSISGYGQRHDIGWICDVKAVAQNMPVNDLYKYWPKSIAPTSYQWVTTHIREGIVPVAEARLALLEDDLGQPFPESAFNVAIQAEGVQVEYLDGHPKVTDVKGVVKFAGKSMTITAQQGKMLSGSTLKDAWLHIPDLTEQPSATMQIKLAVDAPAKDVAHYLAIPKLGYAQPLGLDAETIEGNASGTLDFSFKLPSHAEEMEGPHLQFLIEADVRDGVQPGFMGDKNLTAANGKLTITQEKLIYNGAMALSNAPIDVTLTHSFAPSEWPTEYQASGVMAAPQLQVFGMPELPFLVGDVAFETYIRRSPEAVHDITARANLSQVEATVPEIGFSKPQGKPAMLELEAEAGNGGLTVRSFSLEGEELRAKGSARVGNNMSQLEKLQIDALEFGDNNLSLMMEAQGKDGYKVRAKGASLDLEPVFGGDKPVEEPKTEEEQEYKLPFTLDFQGDFDWVIVGKERELRKVNASFRCDPELCESAEVRGLTGQNNAFAYQIKRTDGVRTLRFSTANAGSFLKAMNIYDNMSGGTLVMNGKFDDTAPGKPFNGHLEINEHTITNAPVLAKIASLLSISGIGDALRGKGITFHQLSTDLTYTKDLLHLKNGKAYGPALGVTLEDGTINTRTKAVRASGTFVPSYTLNTVLDNIPVIGEALSGGKGEGVFAASYKVEGTYPDNTEVSVNPLTMLAPGFLRNIFGGRKGETNETVSETRPAGDAPDEKIKPVTEVPTDSATQGDASTPSPAIDIPPITQNVAPEEKTAQEPHLVPESATIPQGGSEASAAEPINKVDPEEATPAVLVLPEAKNTEKREEN